MIAFNHHMAVAGSVVGVGLVESINLFAVSFGKLLSGHATRPIGVVVAVSNYRRSLG